MQLIGVQGNATSHRRVFSDSKLPRRSKPFASVSNDDVHTRIRTALVTGTGDRYWGPVLGTGTGDRYWGPVLGTGTGDQGQVEILAVAYPEAGRAIGTRQLIPQWRDAAFRINGRDRDV